MFGGRSISYNPSFVREDDAIRVELAENDEPPIFRLWFKCEDGKHSLDGLVDGSAPQPGSIASELGPKVCGNRYRLHRGWKYFGEGKYGIDVDSIVQDGATRRFDITDDLSVLNLTVDCRKRRFFLPDESGNWRRVKRGTIVRSAFDLACSAAVVPKAKTLEQELAR